MIKTKRPDFVPGDLVYFNSGCMGRVEGEVYKVHKYLITIKYLSDVSKCHRYATIDIEKVRKIL